MVESPLAGLLRQRFEELGRGAATQAALVEAFGVNKATVSRLLNGLLRLTPNRARDWSQILFENDPVAAAAFAERLLLAGKATQDLRLRDTRPASPEIAETAAQAGAAAPAYDTPQKVAQSLSVSEFFEDIVNNRGGVTDAKRIEDLLEALQSSQLRNVLICCEYRDFPRAGPDARYEFLAQAVGRAIAGGVSFAMFQPFGTDIPSPEKGKLNTPALAAANYMNQLKTKCIDTYHLFRQESLKGLDNLDASKRPATLLVLNQVGNTIRETETKLDQLSKRIKLSIDEMLVVSRLQLYSRSSEGLPYLGSGLQARMFYIRYTTNSDDINHARIMQWVSTPRRDLLVYRGQEDIHPDALKDSFYPIPHFFDAVSRLPLKIDDSHSGGPGVRRYLKQRPGGQGLPEFENAKSEEAKSIWKPYD